MTLVEVLVVVALVAILMVGVVIGSGAVVRARLKSSATFVTGLVRVAYARASATSRPCRIVFDFDRSRVSLEEATESKLLTVSGETSGGAEAATAEERDALESSERILKGPRAPRARFRAVRALGVEDDDAGGRPLGARVRIRRVETTHMPDGQTSGRAYLYFWPGGQTERAAIQLEVEGATDPDDALTVLVAPMTGRTNIVGGAKPMEKPREGGERDDRGE